MKFGLPLLLLTLAAPSAWAQSAPTPTHPWAYKGTCSGSGNGKSAEAECTITVRAKSDPRNYCGEKFEIQTTFTLSEGGRGPGPNFSRMPLKIEGDKFSPACPSIRPGNTEYSGGGTISEAAIEGTLTVKSDPFGSEPNKFTFKAAKSQ